MFQSFVKKTLLIIDYFLDDLKSLFVSTFNFFINLLVSLFKFLIGIFVLIKNIVLSLIQFIKRLLEILRYSSLKTKLGFFIMGYGNFTHGQRIKGLIFFILQISFFTFLFLPSGGLYWLTKFTTLGTTTSTIQCTVDIFGNDACVTVPGDNSMLIMLYGLTTLLVSIGFLYFYFLSIESSYRLDLLRKQGKSIGYFKDDVRSLLNERFHLSILGLPTVTVFFFTILPLIFMILLAFTNYNGDRQPPINLFTWTGLETFSRLFITGGAFSNAIGSIVQWTFTWAFFATFTNFFGGMILALMINKKGIKLKGLWRTAFVLTIAIPQFVTLLLMRNFLAGTGPLSGLLMDFGWIDIPLNLFANTDSARLTVILVNMWIGIPYTMLITSGILMNIPQELYESAKIDGAGAITQFTKITLPYMFFIMGPYLITAFIGNINNFNVIFFLTGGGPANIASGGLFGDTDLLVTWLYSLTVGGTRQEFALGSAIGIIIFLISSFISLVLFSKTASIKNEEDFQI
jgi:arabinogalactan oligomer/maltooligosaccharide transport system permease protein